MPEWILNALLAVQSHLPTIPTNIAIYGGCGAVLLIFAVALWVAFWLPFERAIAVMKADELYKKSLDTYD